MLILIEQKTKQKELTPKPAETCFHAILQISCSNPSPHAVWSHTQTEENLKLPCPSGGMHH